MMDTRMIRERIKKELGYNARQVSVRQHPCGYSDSFTFTVRDATVDIKKVEAFAHQFESIRRDEYTQEILSGANTYVNTRTTESVDAIHAAQYIEAVKNAIVNLEKESENNRLCLVGNTEYCVGWEEWSDRKVYSLWYHRHLFSFNDPSCAAIAIARGRI